MGTTKRCAVVLILLLIPACARREIGREYAVRVAEDAATVTRAYLAADTAQQKVDPLSARRHAAAATFTAPRLRSLDPCAVTLEFSYQYQGSRSDGTAELRCDPVTGTWVVERLYIMQES